MIQVVFQNKNFVVCNKAAQILSVPAREKSDIRACLGLELQKELKTQVFPVHRLDFEVSGLIIYALHSQAHKISQNWFIRREIRKLYRAETNIQNFEHWPANITTDRSVVRTEVNEKYFWKTQILRGKKRSFESTNGEWAETEATVVAKTNDKVQWQLYPITGKPHQLRLELSRRGFPIVGDSLYGSKLQHLKAGIALEAYELDLTKVPDRQGLPEKISL
jgi:tRNA pseudouridine32 synthase/23S rRNA pseudouridine746 synthase